MFKGVYAALLTPFDEAGEVCPRRLRAHVRFLIDRGINGLYVTGNSGLWSFLSVEERETIFKTVKAEADGRTELIAHVAAFTTRDAVRLARAAADLGYDAVSSLPPVYWPHGADEIYAYYRTLSEATPLPLFIYYIPKLTGQSLPLELMRRLADLPNIRGLKFTDPNFALLRRILDQSGGRWLAFSGPDDLCLPGLTMGAVGAIGTTMSLCPELYLEIYRHYQAGEFSVAERLQQRSVALVELLQKYSLIPAMQTLLRLRGLEPGFCREPLLARLPAEAETALLAQAEEILAEYIGLEAVTRS